MSQVEFVLGALGIKEKERRERKGRTDVKRKTELCMCNPCKSERRARGGGRRSRGGGGGEGREKERAKRVGTRKNEEKREHELEIFRQRPRLECPSLAALLPFTLRAPSPLPLTPSSSEGVKQRALRSRWGVRLARLLENFTPDSRTYRERYEAACRCGDYRSYRAKKGWRDSVLGAPRRLLVTLGSFSRDSSPCPAPKDEPLPSLPVPDLESTMQKYLAQVEAITPSHLDRCRNLVRSFLAGPGPKLQQLLLERRQNKTNWATDWWLHDMYLSVPLALPINSNPGVAARPKRFTNQRDAAVFLGRFLMELLNYQETLDRSELEVERVKSKDGKSLQPLCMAQHYQILKIYRRPGESVDEQIIMDRATSGDHIIVAHHNQFYSVPVRASDRGRITEGELIQQILKIMEIPADPRTPPVGILTTAKRPVWARARAELLKNERNRHNLELLERCLCVVCIDEDVLPSTFNEPVRAEDRWINDRDYANVLHHALHGGGSRHVGANRWFDKTFHAILGKDGMWGLTYEHSAGEAPAIIKAFEDLTEKVDALPPLEENLVPSHLPAPEKLEWYLSERSLNDIREAMTTFDALVEELDLCVLWFQDYTKEFIKSCRISPDAYIQLALQLTYFRLHGRLVATYESAGIRRFALGRVDVIRAASPESLAWVKAMCQGDPEMQGANQPNNDPQEEGTKRVQFTIYSKQRIRELFDLAVQRQANEMSDNIHGLGIDNHLMGLRYAAKEAGEPIPELFLDESYRILNHFALSTSQIVSKNDIILGYGPVVPDGYGCAYNMRKNGFIFSVSAFHTDGRTSAMRFAKAIEQSLRDMATMLKSAKQQ